MADAEGDEEMRQTTLRIPDLMLLVGTRVALGVGIGLLVGSRLDARARKGAGVALLMVGALTTVPILLNLRASSEEMRGPGTERHGAGASHGAPTPQ
jgi:hypothetical protein